MHKNQLILILHICVILLLTYISWSVLNNRPIDKLAGIIIGFIALLMTISHISIYRNIDKEEESEELVVDDADMPELKMAWKRDDPAYEIIGGAAHFGSLENYDKPSCSSCR